MKLALSGEQEQFAASLHEMLSASDGPAAARSWAAGDHRPGLELWSSLAEVGVTGLMIPAGLGGLGADPVDLVIACVELGHHAVPGPVAESLAAVPALLSALDVSYIPAVPAPGSSSFVPPEWRQGQLRVLAAGELLATLAAPPLVPYAADADVAGLVLVAAGDEVAVAAPGRTRRSVDAARTLAEVSAADLVAQGPEATAAIERALELGTLACAAQLLGLGQMLLELAAAHARQRIQFGQPVGSFQAVKHHLADVAIALEFARPLLYAAAAALADADSSSPASDSTGSHSTGSHSTETETARDVSAAKVACADAASLAARKALQVHGAIGYTAEHDAGIYLTKVAALRLAWGSQAMHRRRVLAALTGSG